MSSVALLAIALPRSAAARAIVAAWEAGEAVLPLDAAAPAPGVAATLAAARPTHLLDGDGRRRLARGEPVEDGVAAVVATSGTGGAPKLVELGADAVEWSARATSRALGAGPGDRWLCCVAPHGVAGLAVLARAWHTGLPVEVHERFDPAAVADLAAEATTRGAHLVRTYGLTETFGGMVHDGHPLPRVDLRTDEPGGEILV